MKTIKYKFLSCEIDHGTEEEPNIEQVFLDKTIPCSGAADYEEKLHIAKSEAYNGEVTVEEIPDTETEPTIEERVQTLETGNEELATENKLLKEQVAALSDQNDFQEELIVELANIVYA